MGKATAAGSSWPLCPFIWPNLKATHRHLYIQVPGGGAGTPGLRLTEIVSRPSTCSRALEKPSAGLWEPFCGVFQGLCTDSSCLLPCPATPGPHHRSHHRPPSQSLTSNFFPLMDFRTLALYLKHRGSHPQGRNEISSHLRDHTVYSTRGNGPAMMVSLHCDTTHEGSPSKPATCMTEMPQAEHNPLHAEDRRGGVSYPL